MEPGSRPQPRRASKCVNPATEERLYDVALGSEADVDAAVAGARRAFESFFGDDDVYERVALLSRIIDVYKRRMNDIGAAVSARDGGAARVCAAHSRRRGAGALCLDARRVEDLRVRRADRLSAGRA